LLSDKHIRKSEVGENNNTEPNNTGVTLDVEKLQQMFPAADPDYFRFLNQHASKFGITTQNEMLHVVSQIAHESWSFTKSLYEDLEGRANDLERIKSTYWKFFNNGYKEQKYQAERYFGNPVALANFVYNDAERLAVNPRLSPKDKMSGLGNIYPDDGWKYRGRGIIQLTGRDNYRIFTNDMKKKGFNVDFVADPDGIIQNAEYSVFAALSYFETRVKPRLQEDGITLNEATVEQVSEKVNENRSTYPAREAMYSKLSNANIFKNN